MKPPCVRSTLARTALLVAAVIVLSACYWQPETTGGSLRLEIQVGNGGQIGVQDVTESAARVFLVAGSGGDRRFFPLRGRGRPDLFVPFSNGRAVVAMENIPDGIVYRLFVATGQPFPATGGFRVARYATSQPFKVVSGREVSVAVTLDDAPQVAWTLTGAAVNSLVWNGTTLFAGGGTRVAGVPWTDPDFGSVTQISFESVAVNSIAPFVPPGGAQLIAATSNGLYAGIPGAFARNDEPGSPPSASSAVTFTDGTARAILFSQPGGLGGRRATGGTLDGWFTIDLSEQVNGRPILDMVTDGEEYAFLATRLGAFRVSAAAVDPGWVEWSDLSSASGVRFFGSQIPAPILSLAVATDGAGSGRVFAGTQSGVWWFDSDARAPGWEPGEAQGVSATWGRPVSHIAAIPDSGSGWRIAAASPFELFIVDIDGPVASTISFPFIAAYPGVPSDLVWLSATRLAISGSEGIVVLSVPE